MMDQILHPFDALNCPFRFNDSIIVTIDGRAYALDAVYPFYSTVVEMPYSDINEFFERLEHKYELT